MLLVAQEHVVQQGALAWQESAGDLKGFGMPELAFQLPLLLYFWLEVLGPRLEQEAHLSAHAEVGHYEDGQFVEERVPTHLKLIIRLVHEVFHGDWLNLHYVADI